MLVTETTGIKLLPKIIVLNPKDGKRSWRERRRRTRLRKTRAAFISSQTENDR